MDSQHLCCFELIAAGNFQHMPQETLFKLCYGVLEKDTVFNHLIDQAV